MQSNSAPTVHVRALERAAELLGGRDALEVYLGVTPVKLGLWMRGSIEPPGHVFLRVVDLLLEHDVTFIRRNITDGEQADGSQTRQA